MDGPMKPLFLFSSVRGPAALFLCVLATAGASVAQTFTTTVVAEGDYDPDGSAPYDEVLDNGPALNNSGRVAFAVRLKNSPNRAVIGKGFTPAAFLFLQGEPAPDDNGTFEEFSQFSLNRAGTAGYVGTLSGTSGTYDRKGAFVSDTVVTQIVRGDQPAPGGNGTISAFPVGSVAGALAINSVGEITGRLQLVQTSGESSDDVMIVRGDGSSLVDLARKGQTTSGGDTLVELGAPSINDSSQVAFWARFAGGETFGFFLHDGVDLVEMARSGDVMPGGGRLALFDSRETMVNSSGHIALSVTLSGASFDKAIVLATGTELIEIVRQGSPAPGGGTFVNFRPNSVVTLTDPAVSLNDSGAIAFGAQITPSTGRVVDGLYVFDGGVMSRIAIKDQTSPDGNGTFDFFGQPAINAQGDVVFKATLNSASPGTGSGLFFYDASAGTLRTVIRYGTSLAGSTIGSMVFLNISYQGNSANGFNDSGQVAFRYQLRDGKTGVGLATPNDLAPPVITVDSTEISDTEFMMTWSISTNAGVDIYRTDDLLDWGDPISSNNITGSFTDAPLPAEAAFYQLVPAGQDYP